MGGLTGYPGPEGIIGDLRVHDCYHNATVEAASTTRAHVPPDARRNPEVQPRSHTLGDQRRPVTPPCVGVPHCSFELFTALLLLCSS